jgi:hypothetical protein
VACATRQRFAQFRRQVGDFDQLPRRHDGQPVTEIFELPDVAGKIERAQMLQGCFGEALALDPEFLGTLLQKVAGQDRDVLASFAQAGQAHADDVQAMKEILAKQPLADPRLEILVRRGNDADLGFQGRMAAHPIIMAVRQHAQQARLQFRRHVADFVQEQRAPSACSKRPCRCAAAPVKAATLVAEQLRLEQITRESLRC